MHAQKVLYLYIYVPRISKAEDKRTETLREKRIVYKQKDKKMKKIKLAALCLMFMCGASANAQSLGDILGSVASSATGTSSSDLLSGITSVFSKSKQADQSSIVGTWEYSEPAIVFQSDNLLTKAGASIAAKKIESKMQTQLTKYGIKPGALKMTFNEDGTFSQTLGSKTSSGKWQIKDSKLCLTYLGVKTISLTTQVSSSKLMFVTDASKLLSMAKTIGSASGSSSLSTVVSLMKSVNGLQAGITLVKK